VHGDNPIGHHALVRTADSRHAFEEFLASRRSRLDLMNALSAVELMIDFYLGVRADDVELDTGGDMLLSQWGIYDWGSGSIFQYDVTRQLTTEVIDENHADDALWQLSLTLHYTPTAEARATGSGDHWCSGLDRVDEFREFIRDSAATTVARRAAPRSVELRFEPAG
jgi:hypothetical protein